MSKDKGVNMTHKLFEKAEEDFLMIILPRIVKESNAFEEAKERGLNACKRLGLPTDGLDDLVQEFWNEHWSKYND